MISTANWDLGKSPNHHQPKLGGVISGINWCAVHVPIFLHAECQSLRESASMTITRKMPELGPAWWTGRGQYEGKMPEMGPEQGQVGS